MKVAVAASGAPFADHPRMRLVERLVAHLPQVAPVAAEALRLPFAPRTAEAWLDAAVTVRMLQLFNVDRVIAIDGPASLLRGPPVTIWLVDDVDRPDDPRLHTSDRHAFTRARDVFAATPELCARAAARTGCAPVLLPVPADDAAWRTAAARLLA